MDCAIPLVSHLILVPLAGAAVLLLVPGRFHRVLRLAALFVSLWALWLAFQGFLAFGANPGAAGLADGPRPWIPRFGIRYHAAFHKLNAGLVLLTAILTPLVVVSTWTQITRAVKGFLIALLVLEAGLLGTFLAEDLFLFYVSWETVLIPMYFIIGIWGGTRRLYATTKFVLFTALGSLLMFVAMLVLARHGPTWDFSFAGAAANASALPIGTQRWIFAAFLLAFAVKVPVFPLHTWLPDAHVEAPTGGSILLAGVLLKMGTYGLVRICLPFFPEAAREALPFLLMLCAVGAIWGGLMSLAQKDIKSLVAYSSVSHMAVLVLGLLSADPAGCAGALFQMLAHGVNTGCLFLLVGILYERTHSRLIDDHGGLAKQMPVFSGVFLVACLSSLGLPGLAGFVGEFLILKGLMARVLTSPTAPMLFAFVAAGLALVLSAAYLLWMYKRVFFGPLKFPDSPPPPADLTLRERAVSGFLILLMLAMGLFPGFWIGRGP